MKKQQHEHARHLYLQDNFTKTEIAAKVGVNRRTIMLWAQQGNWDRQRETAQQLPVFLAEQCMQLVNTFTSGLLNGDTALGLAEAQTIHLLASSLQKLKNTNVLVIESPLTPFPAKHTLTRVEDRVLGPATEKKESGRYNKKAA